MICTVVDSVCTGDVKDSIIIRIHYHFLQLPNSRKRHKKKKNLWFPTIRELVVFYYDSKNAFMTQKMVPSYPFLSLQSSLLGQFEFSSPLLHTTQHNLHHYSSQWLPFVCTTIRPGINAAAVDHGVFPQATEPWVGCGK